MKNLAAWTKGKQATGAAQYKLDAQPIGVFYIGESRDNGGYGRRLGYGVSVNFYEHGKALAGSTWNWAQIASVATVREAIKAAVAYAEKLTGGGEVNRAIEVTDSFRTWDEAHEALAGQRCQWGFLGGRVYLRDGRWKLQAIHEPFLGCEKWLPDGMRFVSVPAGVWSTLVPEATVAR